MQSAAERCNELIATVGNLREERARATDPTRLAELDAQIANTEQDIQAALQAALATCPPVMRERIDD